MKTLLKTLLKTALLFSASFSLSGFAQVNDLKTEHLNIKKHDTKNKMINDFLNVRYGRKEGRVVASTAPSCFHRNKSDELYTHDGYVYLHCVRKKDGKPFKYYKKVHVISNGEGRYIAMKVGSAEHESMSEALLGQKTDHDSIKASSYRGVAQDNKGEGSGAGDKEKINESPGARGN